VAEAIAEERSQALDDARLALRMLEAGSAPQALSAANEGDSASKTPDDPPKPDADSPKRGCGRSPSGRLHYRRTASAQLWAKW